MYVHATSLGFFSFHFHFRPVVLGDYSFLLMILGVKVLVREEESRGEQCREDLQWSLLTLPKGRQNCQSYGNGKLVHYSESLQRWVSYKQLSNVTAVINK